MVLVTVLLLAASGAFVLEVEPNHSTLGFSVEIAGGMTRVNGKFTRFEMRMVYDDEDLSRWSIETSIDATSVDTGLEDRDSDLRGPSFFDAARHPKIRFASSRIERRGEGYLAMGELVIRGVSKSVELPFRVTKVEWTEGRPRLGVAAEARLDRNDYGVGSDWKHTLIPNFIGAQVEVEIFLWTKLGKPLGSERRGEEESDEIH